MVKTKVINYQVGAPELAISAILANEVGTYAVAFVRQDGNEQLACKGNPSELRALAKGILDFADQLEQGGKNISVNINDTVGQNDAIR